MGFNAIDDALKRSHAECLSCGEKREVPESERKNLEIVQPVDYSNLIPGNPSGPNAWMG